MKKMICLVLAVFCLCVFSVGEVLANQRKQQNSIDVDIDVNINAGHQPIQKTQRNHKLAKSLIAKALKDNQNEKQSLPGENFFDLLDIPVSGLVQVAKGLDEQGRFAGLTFEFPESVHLVMGDETGVDVIEDFDIYNFFKPLFFTPAGIIVGTVEEGWDSRPAVMFVDGEDYTIQTIGDYGYIIGATDYQENAYVLGNENGIPVLWIVSTEGIQNKIPLAKESSVYSYYDEGGVSVVGTTIYCALPTSFSFDALYLQFISIYEIDLETGVVGESYVLLSEETDLPPMTYFGGITSNLLVGEMDSQPFVHDLTSRTLTVQSICQNSDVSAIAKDIVENWLIGNVGGISIFAKNTDGRGKIIFDFSEDFDSFQVHSITHLNGMKILVQADDEYFYLQGL